MACSLNREQVLDLYELLYGEVIDRIKDSNLPPIDLKQLIKETYDVVKEGSGDQVKALFYAQAIPDVFQMVVQDEEANDYLVDNNFDFTGLAKMRKQFADLAEVGKEVAQEKPSKDEIDSKIKEANKSKKNFSPKVDIDPEILWSENENTGAKVSSVWTTTIQMAIAQNPETVSEEDRNKMDPEKQLFSDVVKAIARIASERVGDEAIVYQGRVITLTALLTKNIDKGLLTPKDKKYMDENPDDNGITAVITDEDGNFLYFTDAGNLTDNPQEGRIVYQYLRKITNQNGKLYVGNPQNTQNRKYTLVDPEVLAQRHADKIEENGGKVSKELFKSLVKQYTENQDREVNQLYELRKIIQDGTVEQIILPITGATFGATTATKKRVSVAEAGITESELKNYTAITTGKDKGKQFIIVKKEKAGGVASEQKLFVTRSDINSELAEKIATVLTTKALLRGRELTPDERKKYFELFINNANEEGKTTNRDRIQVFARVINNEKTLAVELNGKKIPEEVLYTEEGKKLILDHLLGASDTSRPKLVATGKEEGSNGYWPANVSYNNKYHGKPFTEYNVEGNTITETQKNYFDTVKPFMVIVYSDEALAEEQGLNGYIKYVIPEGIIEGDQIVPLYRPKQPSQPTYTPKKDKEQTTPAPKNPAKNKPVTTSTPRQDSAYTISMKNQIQEAGGKVESYKSGLKVNELAEAVNLTEAQIVQFRANALDADPNIKKTVQEASLTETEVKEANIENNPATRASLFSDILEGSSNSALYQTAKKNRLDRSKLRDKFLDRVFTSKADRAAAETWWKNSPLSRYISLERITEIVNSDAFATWSGYGITLYEADGGTSVDLYHEAWHGFSQLFLTQAQKIDLYKQISKLPKYKGKDFSKIEDYEEIEEDLAEEFRSYAKSKGKKATKGFLANIFDKIYQFLQKLFGRTNKKQVATQLQDIESVKVLFDKLYRASENPKILSSLKPSMQNVMFGKLNRTKIINDNFSLEESKKVSAAMDSMMALIFQNYNRDYGTTAAAIKLLKDPEFKKDLYRDIYDRFEKLRITYLDEVEKNDELLLDPKFVEEYDLLQRITDNYGNLTASLERKQKNNVIAYHLDKSVFKVLREQYEEIEDPSNIEKTSIFINMNGGNSISSKELSSEETMMLLASVFEVTRVNGEVVNNREGLFGLPKLQDVSVTWNKLAKILQGSFDEMDMYVRLFENSENYPEIQQLLTLLPNPFQIRMGAEYDSSLEFDSETNFWQDFKKPRIPYIQLNLNKEVKKIKDGVKITEYEARIAKANFDVYQVIQDWKNNFSTADTTINPYIIKDKYDRNMLNTAKIVSDFGISGSFNYRKANDFLKAIGVVLDQSSAAIKSIINNTETPFSTTFGVDRIYEIIKKVNKSTSSDALLFKREPLIFLLNGLPESLRDSEKESESVSGRLRAIAEIQNEFSDSYSNFSVQTPEGNRVWEHVVDNTITRVITAINFAKNWEELTTDEADPNGRFKHMRWLNEQNNTFSPFSKLLRSIFDLDQMSSTYGQKITDTKITLQNVAGTQMVSTKNEGGTSTASMDATSKYLQEFHTMLLNGVEEFMRHASKNTSMGMSVDGEVLTYNGKKAKKLYVDIESFLEYADGEIKGYDIVEGYIAAEANRIVRFQQNIDKFKKYAGYNREVKRKDNKKTKVMAGQAFSAFDDVLSQDVQAEIYTILDKVSKNPLTEFNFIKELDNNLDLRNKIRKDVAEYFNKDTDENLERLREARYVDKGLYDRIKVTNDQLTNEDIDRALTKAYTYNSFIHKMETVILAYGDLAQYNHAKEEFHKRNAGLGSGGRGFRADRRAQIYLSSLKNYYAERRGYKVRNYDGTLVTAIMKEMTFNSVMYKEYRDELEEMAYSRMKNRAKAKEYADRAAAEYFNMDKPQMKIADGQGVITFEWYRILKIAEGNWSARQELLYRKVSLGENITAEDVVEFFPPYKLQYFGNIESEGLPITSFHKFSLAPIIPGVAKPGTPMFDLHEKMMKDQVDYVTFESGSKVGHMGTGDVMFNPDGTLDEKATFTKNIIYTEFLKNQTEINSSYKGKSIFSTQLRKLILEGLYAQGKIKSTKYEDITNKRVRRYIDHVEEYTNLLKLELLEEMGYEEVSPNVYKAKDKSSTGKLLNMIRQNLEREDLLSDDLIEFIDVYEDSGELQHDLSFHPEAAKIEKLLLSMINKRVIKQKVAGEPLVQVSVGMYANQFTQPDLRKATKDEIKKWASTTYLLPTYHKKSNGYTAAAKVMIAMQGTYYNLFNLEYQDGETIGVYFEDGTLDMDTSLTRLNEKIKDDAWLNADNEANRKAITLVGVRIPVQGLNSMEFAEVFEFLPPQAGNIIIPPAEIVAKSGGDFDIDKLTIFMNTLNEDGKVVERKYKDLSAIKALRGSDEFAEAVRIQKLGLENELIQDIKEILELPENYASLIMPNGTYILKEIADKLAADVMKYNPKKNKMTDNTGEVSPTRVLEALYNVYKHESNIVGKKTLGLGAIENTFNVILNSIGAYMPKEYIISELTRTSNMRLRHNKMKNSKGDEVISMSDLYDVDGINKISDVISQMINGWVDVEKDAWIFFIQGNYEVAPTLIYLIKAGVPVKEAIYFVSSPLVREYVDEQRLAKSTFADVLNKKPKHPGLVKYQAASNIIQKYFSREDVKKTSKNDDRYAKGQELLDNYFKGKPQKHFTETDMYTLIQTDDRNSDMARAMFLHYLELEQQIAGYTALKMASNPDTSTKSTLSDVEQTESNIANLFYDSRVPREIVESIMDDSILKSFFNGPLALAVSRPLFKLRYHPVITSYLIENNGRIRDDLDTVFPGGNVEYFSNVFRNDIVSFILQNAIRKYKKEDGFMSLNMETKIPTSMAKELKRGAFVKDGTLYLDMKQLQKEFDEKAWIKNSESENSYDDRGLYALHPSTFMNNNGVNFNEYVKFVSEREYLRSITPMSKEYVDSFYFQEELKNTKELFEDLSNEKAIRYTYEKLLAIKALDNSYNFFHLFQDSENAFAIRMTQLLQNYPDLKKDFPVLSKLKFDSSKQDNAYNLYIADKDFDNDKSNLYTDDLKMLADYTVNKVDDPIENARISSMFKYLNMYAFLQTGLNKTKLSFTNITDFNDILPILEDEAKLFITALEKSDDEHQNTGFPNELLDDFYDIFIRQNDSNKNPNKSRYKDYLSEIDYENFKPTKPSVAATQLLDVDIKFEEDKNTGYAARTKINASADATVALAVNFDSAGEKLTKSTVLNQNKKYIPIDVKDSLSDIDVRANEIVQQLNSVNAQTLNIAGNGIYTMNGKYTQQEVDNFTYELLKAVVESPNLKNKIISVRTGGQTGFDEAGAKAGVKLGIPTTILAPKGWKFRDLSGTDISNEEAFKARFTTQPTGVKPETDSTNLDKEPIARRLGLKSTDDPTMFTYNDANAKNLFYYKNLGKSNPDVVFVHNVSLYELMPNQKERGINLGGASNFMTEVPDMSVNFPTELFTNIVNNQRVPVNPDQYNVVKEIWEKRIKILKEIQDKNGKLAFPEYGFGDPRTMPQELFVYLSKRLFEEFQYVNPGSTMYNEIRSMIGVSQGITDEEILIQLELEEDPFKCS